MDIIQRTSVAAHTAVTAFVAGAFDKLRTDRGQGSVEYAGIVLIVAAIVAVAIAATPADVLTGPITTKIGEAFNKLTGS